MRVKSLFIVIVLNIFLTLFASLMLEYVSLSERISSLEQTVQVSLDGALSAATGSEEMFSEKFQTMMSSFATGANKTGAVNPTVYTTSLLYDGGKFYQVNTYALAKYYEDTGKMPTGSALSDLSQTAFGSNVASGDYTRAIFEWLYGKTGSDWTNDNLEWANGNNSFWGYTTESPYDANGISKRPSGWYVEGKASGDFVEYVQKVGLMQTTAGYLKGKSTDFQNAGFALSIHKYPTLLNMGLDFSNLSCQISSKAEANSGTWNSVTSDYTIDNFSTSVKLAKSYLSNNITKYYLTPASLGVTYVPVAVLKPAFLANLDTTVRLNSLASGAAQVSGGSYTAHNDTATLGSIADLDRASQCMGTSVYTFGGGGATDSDGSALHTKYSGEDIVQDGNVEYDKDSVKVKVDYFYVDFSQDTADNKIIIQNLNGLVGGENVGADQSSLAQDTLDAFQTEDSATQINDDQLKNLLSAASSSGVGGERIVARVSVRLRVHIPYKSSILQWMDYRFHAAGATTGWHAGIKNCTYASPNMNGDGISVNEDGVWYQYTTFFMQSRT